MINDLDIKNQVSERRKLYLRQLNERALFLLDVLPTWELLTPTLQRQISRNQKEDVEEEEEVESSSFDVKRTRFFVRLWRQIGKDDDSNKSKGGYRERVRSSISTSIRAFLQSDVSVPQLKQALKHRHEVAQKRTRGLQLFARLLRVFNKDSTLQMRIASSLNKCRFRPENGLRNGYDDGLSGTGAKVAVTIAKATREVEDAVCECLENNSMTTIEHVRAKLALLSWCASSVGDVSPHILSRRYGRLATQIEKLRLECMISTRRDESIEQSRIGKICLVGEEISEPVVEVKVQPKDLERRGFTIVSRIYHTSSHLGTLLSRHSRLRCRKETQQTTHRYNSVQICPERRSKSVRSHVIHETFTIRVRRKSLLGKKTQS